jgi:flagellar hook-associated protein 3 FlgL
MRVSTAQFYLQSSQQMSSKSSDVNEQMAYLTSGKRVLTAKDDAVAYGTLAGYKDDLANIEKYKRNITQAESHNSLQDVVFADAENILNSIKDKLLQASNGAMTDQDLQAIAKEARNNFDHLIDLANSQNENGDYIFSGYQTDHQPFSQQVDGSVSYSGDSGIQEIQIAKNITIPTNQSGDAAFMKVDNAIGDFSVNYPTAPSANTSGVAVESADVTDRNVFNTTAGPHNYTFTFGPGAADLNVLDGVVNVYSTTTYETGQDIPLSTGVNVTLSGNPLPGDNFVISEQEEIGIFDTIKDALAWLDKGVVTTDVEQHQVDYNTILDQLNTATSHITSRRVDAGIRMQVLETQESRHLDTELSLASGKSNIEDLDFAKAISEFEQAKLALQASQQAFSKVQGLSLLNYI